MEEAKKKKGEELKVGELTYIIVPDQDYFRGIPTILNSEEAALVVVEKISNSLKAGFKFFDQDFGPKNPKDAKGSATSLYFDGNPPNGYRRPEDIEWRRPEEF